MSKTNLEEIKALIEDLERNNRQLKKDKQL